MATSCRIPLLFTLLATVGLFSGSGVALASSEKSATQDSLLTASNGWKCGVVKGEEDAASVAAKRPAKLNRVAKEEPGMRCGGVRTSDGRFAVALLPDSAFSQTLEEYPTFLIYMPFTSVKEGIFSISHGPNSYPYYQSVIHLTGKRGIIRFQLPQSTSALMVGRQYYWQFRFKAVNDENDEQLLVIRGHLQRVNPSAALKNTLAEVSQQEKPVIYARNNIWQDALASLAQLRQTTPNDQNVNARWASLLQQIQLRELASEPVLEVAVRSAKSKR